MSLKPLFIAVIFAINTFHFIPLEKKIISTEPIDSISTVTLSFVGDLMCHSVQYNYAQKGKDSFDFKPVYRFVSNYFNQSDFVAGNFETVTAGAKKTYSGYPNFNSPDAFLTDLQEVGFNFLFTSNNHSFDRGEIGVIRTIDVINSTNLRQAGTYRSSTDRDSIRIININNIRFAFLAYTYGVNGKLIPKGKDYLVNLIDTMKIRNDIEIIRKKVDCIIVYFHFGEEYQREPNHYQKMIVRKTIESGADVIIGSHPHVIQPIDVVKSNGRIDSVLVAYSLGNFISNQRWRYSDAGVILNIQINKHSNNENIKLGKVDFIPTYVFKGMTNFGREYLIIPDNTTYQDSISKFMLKKEIADMKTSFLDTYEILTKYSSRPVKKNN